MARIPTHVTLNCDVLLDTSEAVRLVMRKLVVASPVSVTRSVPALSTATTRTSQRVSHWSPVMVRLVAVVSARFAASKLVRLGLDSSGARHHTWYLAAPGTAFHVTSMLSLVRGFGSAATENPVVPLTSSASPLARGRLPRITLTFTSYAVPASRPSMVWLAAGGEPVTW